MINRLTVNAADLAASYKWEGMPRHRAWDQFVIDRALKPELSAKEFYAVYDSVTMAPLPEPRKATLQAGSPARMPDPEFRDYGRSVEYRNVPGSHIGGLRDREVIRGTVERTLQGSMSTLYEVRVGDESRATSFRIPSQNVRFLDED